MSTVGNQLWVIDELLTAKPSAVDDQIILTYQLTMHSTTIITTTTTTTGDGCGSSSSSNVAVW